MASQPDKHNAQLRRLARFNAQWRQVREERKPCKDKEKVRLLFEDEKNLFEKIAVERQRYHAAKPRCIATLISREPSRRRVAEC